MRSLLQFILCAVKRMVYIRSAAFLPSNNLPCNKKTHESREAIHTDISGLAREPFSLELNPEFAISSLPPSRPFFIPQRSSPHLDLVLMLNLVRFSNIVAMASGAVGNQDPRRKSAKIAICTFHLATPFKSFRRSGASLKVFPGAW